MNQILFALKLAKDCTYADAMTEEAKEHLRNELDLAIKEFKVILNLKIIRIDKKQSDEL